jgi:UDP-N-acetylmuramate dehydrogenase
MQQNIKKKQLSQPLNEISAGSFFKNPIGGTDSSAGHLLDQAGAKKIKVGGAGFSKKHANFLINRKNATASDIKILAEKAKILVNDKFNKVLEEEIEYIGEWE